MEPQQLGRYVIEGVLGRGAMGVVYLARDPVIGRRLALKTLTVPAEAEEAEEFRQRFLREAQAAGILNHPGIVTVHDAGVDDASGLSFIAMEYIEGQSLKELLKGGHMFAFSEVARIVAALGGALDYAHSKGVVHRDIKPANIILTPQGMVKITDFGVARLESSNLTATGQFIGTPNYMSPEQVAGSAVDGRSDLFSLGVVLFELLTGGRPFVGASLTEVSYKIVHEPPPIPSQLRAGLPPAFNPIVLKLLEKDPGKRYQRGADVARALEALRRVLAGVAGEVTKYASPGERSAANGLGLQSVHAAPTATRATVVTEAPVVPMVEAPVVPRGPSIWRLPIEPRWVAILLTAVVIPPLLTVIVMLRRVDRGPFGAPPADEPARRHAVAEAQRAAAAALAAGHPEEVPRLLADVWTQAPYSELARGLLLRARQALSVELGEKRRREEARRLLDDGKRLLDANRWGEAESRFSQALELAPDDPLAREYLGLARSGARLSGRARQEAVRPSTPGGGAALVQPLTGEGRLELYFNCPLSAGSYQVLLDGKQVAAKDFSFYRRGLFGLKKKGSGVVEDAFTVPAAGKQVTVRLKGEDGRVLGEQNLAVDFAASRRWVLKIGMDGEQGVPRFTLTPLRSR